MTQAATLQGNKANPPSIFTSDSIQSFCGKYKNKILTGLAVITTTLALAILMFPPVAACVGATVLIAKISLVFLPIAAKIVILAAPCFVTALFAIISKKHLNTPVAVEPSASIATEPHSAPEIRIPIQYINIAQTTPDRWAFPVAIKLSTSTVLLHISCGHWNKLVITEAEKESEYVNLTEHFHELLPSGGKTVGVVTIQNGICGTEDSLALQTNAVAKMITEGTLVIGIYNPSHCGVTQDLHGFTQDLGRASSERDGVDTSIVKQTREFMIWLSSNVINRINPKMRWLHIAHSEGGVIAHNAIQGMNHEQRALLRTQLYLLGIAPAKPLPSSFARSTNNIYSQRDGVTGWFGIPAALSQGYKVRYIESSPRARGIIDHNFLNPTYQTVIRKAVKELRRSVKFYHSPPQDLPISSREQHRRRI